MTVLSSTSGLFTLLLTAVFPASISDRFSVSKLVCVFLSIAGVVSIIRVDKGYINVFFVDSRMLFGPSGRNLRTERCVSFSN